MRQRWEDSGMIDGIRRARAAGRTAVFVANVLPMLPSRATHWVTPDPVREPARYPTTHGLADGEIYRPSTPGPHPGVVVCLGVVPFEVDHPQVPRLGQALARSGFAALLYWSPVMRDLRLDPGDIEGIALAYRWLIEQPFVDSARSGLFGTCVGGSFALMAAAHPTIRDRVAFAGAFAPYGSMETLAREIATCTRRTRDGMTGWEVDQLTRQVFVRSLTAHLAPEEADLLRSAYGTGESHMDINGISPDGQLIAPLLGSLAGDEFDAAMGRLPLDLRERLGAMSPLRYLPDIHASCLILAHDVDDQVIPIDQSWAIRDALAGRPGFRYTEFTMFKHLDPTKVALSRVALLRELLRFGRMFYPMFDGATRAGAERRRSFSRLLTRR